MKLPARSNTTLHKLHINSSTFTMGKKIASKKPSSSNPAPSSHKSTHERPQPPSKPEPAALIPQRHQQRLLDLLSSAFNDTLSDPGFPSVLQEIKQALYNRDFATAFGKEEYLHVYAARWSPTRALCYASVLVGIEKYLEELYLDEEDTSNPRDPSNNLTDERNEEKEEGEEDDEVTHSVLHNDESTENPQQREPPPTTHPDTEPSPSDPKKSLTMLAIGGCAAEHLSFASYQHLVSSSINGHLTLLDSGPWSPIVTTLQDAILSPSQLSKYASSAAKASNKPLVSPPNTLTTSFTQQDVLSFDLHSLRQAIGTQRLLVALMFTLNELYTSGGIGPTTTFLKTLGEALPDGSMLLVVDSPGSYSEAKVGKDKETEKKKKYPMQWLLHHTLVEIEHEGYKWERLESEESVWFRLSEGLRYPIPLENMRYQIHLYRVTTKNK